MVNFDTKRPFFLSNYILTTPMKITVTKLLPGRKRPSTTQCVEQPANEFCGVLPNQRFQEQAAKREYNIGCTKSVIFISFSLATSLTQGQTKRVRKEVKRVILFLTQLNFSDIIYKGSRWFQINN